MIIQKPQICLKQLSCDLARGVFFLDFCIWVEHLDKVHQCQKSTVKPNLKKGAPKMP